MASLKNVKQYLAHWFQLDKKVLLRNGQEILLPPKTIIQGDRYSDEFEKCWQTVLSPNSRDCYLEGSKQSFRELLTPAWEIESCARCQMPVAAKTLGIQPIGCPCSDLNNWPNTELPRPRSPIDSLARIKQISQRLNKVSNNSYDLTQTGSL